MLSRGIRRCVGFPAEPSAKFLFGLFSLSGPVWRLFSNVFQSPTQKPARVQGVLCPPTSIKVSCGSDGSESVSGGRKFWEVRAPRALSSTPGPLCPILAGDTNGACVGISRPAGRGAGVRAIRPLHAETVALAVRTLRLVPRSPRPTRPCAVYAHRPWVTNTGSSLPCSRACRGRAA